MVHPKTFESFCFRADKNPSQDAGDQDESRDNASETPSTPVLGSEAGDSITDPGSVPTPTILSPPSIGMSSSKPPPPKKHKSVHRAH